MQLDACATLEDEGRATLHPGRELSTIWEERLWYGYRAAHTIVSTPEVVTLLGVTQIGPGGFSVTAKFDVALP